MAAGKALGASRDRKNLLQALQSVCCVNSFLTFHGALNFDSLALKSRDPKTKNV